MKKTTKTENETVAGIPAIVIDSNYEILLSSSKGSSRHGALIYDKKPSEAEMENILARTGTKFGIGGSGTFYTRVFFLGDIRTLKSKINRWY